MVENLESEEVSVRFLSGIEGSTAKGKPTFAFKEVEVARFPQSEVVKKLPQSEREQQFIFPCNHEGWNVEQLVVEKITLFFSCEFVTVVKLW